MLKYLQQFITNVWLHLNELLIAWGVSTRTSNWLTITISLLILAIFLGTFYYMLKKLTQYILNFISICFHVKFFNSLINNHFHHFFSLWICYFLLQSSAPAVFSGSELSILFTTKVLYVFFVFINIRVAMSVVSTGFDTLKKKENYHDRPINSYLQVIRIILIIIGLILIISDLTSSPPLKLLTTLGAASAIILFMFKDMIMGLVASVQVTSNDMIRIGDWITMPKYGADGDVIEITLTTVKVSNFDKTITTIPTYALISDSFQNWRGMFSSGGRRIKRAIIIKQSSIRYIADCELPRFKKIQGISDYIDKRQEEIRLHNEAICADRSIPINGRNLTNAGLYRKYAEWYLNNHPGTNKNMILMVRQMAPTENGMPLELYAFTNTTRWVDYEYIMADIFDHLIAAVRHFDLHIYERESGSDIQHIMNVDEDFEHFTKK